MGPSLSPLTPGEGRSPSSPSPRLRGEGRGEGLRATGIDRGSKMTVAPTDIAILAAPSVRKRGVRETIRRHPTIVIGAALLGLMALMAIFAPYLGTVDPQALSP